MKKIIHFIVLVASVLLCTAFSSCREKDENPSVSESLAKPEVTISEQQSHSFTLTWKAVDNADLYACKLNSGIEKIVHGTSITYDNIAPGSYNVKIQARSNEPEKYPDSEWTEITVELAETFDPDIEGRGYYYGDQWEDGIGTVDLYFSKGDLRIDVEYMEAILVGEGTLLCISLNMNMAEDPDFVKLNEGTYSFGELGERMSINGEGQSFYAEKEGSKEYYGYLTGGKIKIAEDPEEPYCYKITGTVETSDKKVIEVAYHGKIRPRNQSEEGSRSNIENDIQLGTELVQGSQQYFEDPFSQQVYDFYIVCLADKNFNMETYTGKGENIMLYFNVPFGTNNGLLDGTYSIASDPAEGIYEQNSCLIGDFSMGNYFGCWYFYGGDQREAAFKEGEITVENKTDGNYRLTGYGIDGRGHRVTFDYDGPLPLSEIEF